VTVTSDSAGNAQVIIRADVDAPTQPAQIRATDIASGQQITGDFLIQQRTDGATILTVVPPEATFTGPYVNECSRGFRVDYFIYGGTPPYRITQAFPTGSTLVDSIVSANGGFFEVISNGTCVNPQTFSILDATGRQTTAQLFNIDGNTVRPVEPEVPPSDLAIVPASLAVDCQKVSQVDFVITGGTPPYNAYVSPVYGTAPDTGPTVAPLQAGSGGVFTIARLNKVPQGFGVTVSFIDSGSPQKTATRIISCSSQ